MPTLGILIKSAKAKRTRVAVKQPRLDQNVSVGLAAALFSTTQRRTLGLLFGQPNRHYFANELISLTGSGSGAVQRELRRLTDSGLVVASRAAGRRYFQANAASPLFDELRSIVLKTVGAAEPLKIALAPLASQIRFAAIYGSVAKGQEAASSDLDLLIVSDQLPLERLYAALAPVERQLSRKVNVTLYSSKEFQSRLKESHPFLTRVLGGELIVLIGSAHELASPR
jgi:predicted nucleotidyltransferase